MVKVKIFTSGNMSAMCISWAFTDLNAADFFE